MDRRNRFNLIYSTSLFNYNGRGETEQEEGKDKCQSVETCLGIQGRRGGG